MPATPTRTPKTPSLETRVYRLDPDESKSWLEEGPSGEDFRSFTLRVLGANEPAGRRIEVYAHDQRLLHVFTVA